MSEPSFTEQYFVPMTHKKFFEFFSVEPDRFTSKKILNVGAGGKF